MQNNNQYSYNLNASSYVPKNKGQYNQQYNNNVTKSKLTLLPYFKSPFQFSLLNFVILILLDS